MEQAGQSNFTPPKPMCLLLLMGLTVSEIKFAGFDIALRVGKNGLVWTSEGPGAAPQMPTSWLVCVTSLPCETAHSCCV